MTIGECKQGDIVWIADVITHDTYQVEVLDDCTDVGYLKMKNVRVLFDDKNGWLEGLFYTKKCFLTKEEAENERLAIEEQKKRSQDVHDARAMNFFAEKQKKIKCLEHFLKKEGLYEEYLEFEKRMNENRLKSWIGCGPLINELLDYGTEK